MGDIKSKHRILDILSILKEGTDHDTGLTLEEIKTMLEKKYGENFSIDPRSIRDDIRALEESGYNIITRTLSHNKKSYSLIHNDFDLHELQFLVDVISSARFLNIEETRQLIKKIKGLTSQNQGKKLQQHIYLDGRVKLDNNHLRTNMMVIHHALNQRRKISFQYGSYGMDKKFHLHREGAIYTALPYSLVWSNDFYYLIAEDSVRGVVNFRIDRMRDVRLSDERYIKVSFNTADYVKKSFSMYPATRIEQVRIQFSHDLIGSVIDKFGFDVSITPIDEGHFILRTEVGLNHGFIKWVLSCGSKAKALSPPSLIEDIKKEIKKINSYYDDTP